MAIIPDAMLNTMIELAKDVCRHAYSPYSNFPVGAAILAENGDIFTGCNLENAVSPLGICAERSAISQMISSGQRKIIAVVIYTPTPTPTAPCGCCRHTIHEFGPEALIVSICKSSVLLKRTLPELLPYALGPQDVKPQA